jgi:hypothetical protein
MKQIENKINRKQYQNVRQFREDLELLCRNCRQYNEDGSVLYQDANLIEVSSFLFERNTDSSHLFLLANCFPKIRVLPLRNWHKRPPNTHAGKTTINPKRLITMPRRLLATRRIAPSARHNRQRDRDSNSNLAGLRLLLLPRRPRAMRNRFLPAAVMRAK